MKNKTTRSVDEIDMVVHKYADILLRICVTYLDNDSDAQDVVQETFIKYMTKAPIFNDDEHEKAWLIRVAINSSLNLIKGRKIYEQIDESKMISVSTCDGQHDVMKALMQLNPKYRLLLELYYVEGYKTKELAAIIGKSESAVKMRLKRGRQMLEKIYREEFM